MSLEKKKKCCEGCKKGQPGKNKPCAAKLMLDQIKLKNERKQISEV